jgi:hypothetical protein
MARDREYWQRHEEFQRTGVWPKTQKQKNEAEAQIRNKRLAHESQRAAAGISPNLSSVQANEILNWHKNNPDNAAFDNNGNPVEHD